MVARIVPANFVDLKLELLVCFDLERFAIDEADEVVFVADCDSRAVRGPRNIQILT